MTNPSGVCFLSYHRSRASEAAHVIGALHEHGIPTWQDIADMTSGRTEEELQLVLRDENTASAVLFITPEVQDSRFVRHVEAPLIFQRHLQKDGFVAVVIAAGGLDFQDVANILGETTGAVDLDHWNIKKCTESPVTEKESAQIAEFVLEQRLAMLTRQLPSGEPLKLEVSTRGPLGKNMQKALVADFCHQFRGRFVLDRAWEEHILPGLRAIKCALRRYSANRRIECSGTHCLPAAVALGIELMPTTNLTAVWTQEKQKVGRTA